MNGQPKMIPDQSPYTPEELKKLYDLLHLATLGDPGEENEAEVIRKERKPKRMFRRFYLNRSEPIPGRNPKAWFVGGVLERIETCPCGYPDCKERIVGFLEVSIMGSSKYDALCRLDDRLKEWGVEPENIHTA